MKEISLQKYFILLFLLSAAVFSIYAFEKGVFVVNIQALNASHSTAQASVAANTAANLICANYIPGKSPPRLCGTIVNGIPLPGVCVGPSICKNTGIGKSATEALGTVQSVLGIFQQLKGLFGGGGGGGGGGQQAGGTNPDGSSGSIDGQGTRDIAGNLDLLDGESSPSDTLFSNTDNLIDSIFSNSDIPDFSGLGNDAFTVEDTSGSTNLDTFTVDEFTPETTIVFDTVTDQGNTENTGNTEQTFTGNAEEGAVIQGNDQIDSATLGSITTTPSSTGENVGTIDRGSFENITFNSSNDEIQKAYLTTEDLENAARRLGIGGPVDGVISTDFPRPGHTTLTNEERATEFGRPSVTGGFNPFSESTNSDTNLEDSDVQPGFFTRVLETLKRTFCVWCDGSQSNSNTSAASAAVFLAQAGFVTQTPTAKPVDAHPLTEGIKILWHTCKNDAGEIDTTMMPLVEAFTGLEGGLAITAVGDSEGVCVAKNGNLKSTQTKQACTTGVIKIEQGKTLGTLIVCREEEPTADGRAAAAIQKVTEARKDVSDISDKLIKKAAEEASGKSLEVYRSELEKVPANEEYKSAVEKYNEARGELLGLKNAVTGENNFSEATRKEIDKFIDSDAKTKVALGEFEKALVGDGIEEIGAYHKNLQTKTKEYNVQDERNTTIADAAIQNVTNNPISTLLGLNSGINQPASKSDSSTDATSDSGGSNNSPKSLSTNGSSAIGKIGKTVVDGVKTVTQKVGDFFKKIGLGTKTTVDENGNVVQNGFNGKQLIDQLGGLLKGLGGNQSKNEGGSKSGSNNSGTSQNTNSDRNTSGNTSGNTTGSTNGNTSINASGNTPSNTDASTNTTTGGSTNTGGATAVRATPTITCGGGVDRGADLSLTWSCVGGTNTATEGINFTTSGVPSGQKTIPAEHTVYGISCDGGVALCSATLYEPSLTLDASPKKIASGATTTLLWVGAELTADSCGVSSPTIPNFTGSGMSIRGSTTSPELTATSTFAIQCETKGKQTIIKEVTVGLTN